jgi:hypothetical protein
MRQQTEGRATADYRRAGVVNIAEPQSISRERYIAWLDTGITPPTRCYVEDISRSGAKIKAFSPDLPGEFTLHFSRRGDAKVRCRVKAVAGAHWDVEFVAAPGMYA